MSPRSKKEYAEAILLRYKLTSRNQKTVILIEFRAACGYDRKHAIRVFRRLPEPVRIHSKSEAVNSTLTKKPLTSQDPWHIKRYNSGYSIQNYK